MAHTTGLFKEGHLGDPIEVIGQGTKYTIENIQFVKVNPEGNSKVSSRMPQWDSIPNLSYQHTKEFISHLGVDF